MSTELPKGLWLGVRVPPGTTEEEIIQLFLDRCGVKVEKECISIWDKLGDIDGKVQVVISFTDATLCNLITWVTSEDYIRGEALFWTPPLRPARKGASLVRNGVVDG
jgi:hypothetical protein